MCQSFIWLLVSEVEKGVHCQVICKIIRSLNSKLLKWQIWKHGKRQERGLRKNGIRIDGEDLDLYIRAVVVMIIW